MGSKSKSRVITIANQKGGVGKTTTAINLATALAAVGKTALIVDLDPQGNASTGLGIDKNNRPVSTYDVLTGNATLADTVMPTAVPRLFVAPSTLDLLGVEMEIAGLADRAFRIRKAIEEYDASGKHFDYVLIDCPPSLNLLTVNAMVAANSVLVPLQAEFYALEGLSQLLMTVREVRQTANPDLRIDGVLLTMADNRNNLSQQVEADARNTLAGLVYRTVIPRNVRLSEAPSHAVPVLQYDPNSKGSAAYRDLAAEFLSRQLTPA